MKVNPDTINLGYLHVERYEEIRKTEIILLGQGGMRPYSLGKVLTGEDAGKFVLYPSHVGTYVETKTQYLVFIPKFEVIAYVEPEENTEFVAA